MRLGRKAMAYMWRHNKLAITIIVCLSVFGIFCMFIPITIEGNNLLATFHNNMMGPIVAFATLGIAFLVFISENYQDWESSLPKRLTVNFINEGKLIMRCEGSFLSSEADIRAWGQQLGRQMAKADLNFQPNIKLKPQTGPVYDDIDQLHVKKYEATFILRALPEELYRKHKENFDRGLSLVWRSKNDFHDDWGRFQVESGWAIRALETSDVFVSKLSPVTN